MIYQVVYLTFAFLGLAALAKVIWTIGEALGDCPVTGPVAKAGALSIVTGFVAIGLGIIALGGAWIVGTDGLGTVTVYSTLGVIGILLGLGFTQAALTLRQLVQDMNDRLNRDPADANGAADVQPSA